MFPSFSRFILRLFGWKLEGVMPEQKQYIIAVAPHTSNWDFVLGVFARSAMHIKSVFVAKDSLFRFPLGYIFRALGGYPVDRSKHSNYVDSIVEIFKREKAFVLTIAPEGTRKKVDKFKTGFYYIAKGAGVPIVMCKFDWVNKIVGFSPPFYPTDDTEADFRTIYAYYKGVVGKNPEYTFVPGE